MSGEQEKPDSPVVSGLVALVAVALAVGLTLALVTFAMVNMVGLTEESSADGGATERESLYLPKPKLTDDQDDPEVTLATEAATGPTDAETEDRGDRPRKPKEAKRDKAISLSAASTTVTAGTELYLTGTYPGGEGQILQVQRFQDGAWVDFPATISVSDETFTTYIIPGVTGQSRFRVVDNSTGKASNEVSVLVR